MALIKHSLMVHPLIVSKMIFVCNSCNHIDIIDGDTYQPEIKKKCPKCQSIMILNSTNTDEITIKSLDHLDDISSNRSEDSFDKPFQK